MAPMAHETAHETAHDLESLVRPVVAAAGLLLDGVELGRSGGRPLVSVTVDLADDDPGVLDLDRLEQVSADVSAALDAAPALGGGYVLEVGSPGAERPLTRPAQLRRNLGRRVRVTTATGTTVGRLAEVTDGSVVVVPSGPAPKGRRPRELPPVRIAHAEIRSARVEVDLSGLTDVDDERAARDHPTDDEED